MSAYRRGAPWLRQQCENRGKRDAGTLPPLSARHLGNVRHARRVEPRSLPRLIESQAPRSSRSVRTELVPESSHSRSDSGHRCYPAGSVPYGTRPRNCRTVPGTVVRNWQVRCRTELVPGIGRFGAVRNSSPELVPYGIGRFGAVRNSSPEFRELVFPGIPGTGSVRAEPVPGVNLCCGLVLYSRKSQLESSRH